MSGESRWVRSRFVRSRFVRGRFFVSGVVIVAGLALSAALTSVAQASGDAAKGKAKSAVCVGCHGPDGNSVNPIWPKIAGQHEAYLIKAMKDFRAGVRKDPVMGAMAKPLTDEDIANLAAYYASQKQR